MTKLIYIGGYGHSGSTLLEYLMAGSPAVLACGEVVSSVRERERDSKRKICSCGRAPNACPIWSSFHSPKKARPGSHAGLLKTLMGEADGQYAALVDSSKTAWGSFAAPFRLRRRFGTAFMLFHLTRQPAAVCWSVLRKKQRRAKKQGRRPFYYAVQCGSAVASWSIANLACELFGLLYPDQYIRLRYEDLVRSPIQVLNSLFKRVLPGVTWTFNEGDIRDNRHQLHGNSVKRHDLRIADVKEDLKWVDEMPPEYARLVLALSYPLRLRYGY